MPGKDGRHLWVTGVTAGVQNLRTKRCLNCADGVSIDAYVGYKNNAPLGTQIVRKLCAE